MNKQTVLANAIAAIAALANKADDVGEQVVADKLDAVLASTNLIKLAFNEGGQPFWILNGRAFELAYKEKRGKGEKKKSAQECWFEVLEEFQTAINEDGKSEMIKKYLKTKSAASAIIGRTSEAMLKGEAPGVAFYEAMEYFSSGEYVKNTLKKAIASIVEIGQDEEFSTDCSSIQGQLEECQKAFTNLNK